MATDIVIRTGLDRLRYALLFEGILVVAFAALTALLFDQDLVRMGGLAITLSLIALLVTFVYNYVFDRFDVRNGRVPTQRTRGWRMVHAIGFETTLVIIGLPLIMWWMSLTFWQALLFDIGAMAAVVVYTYFFTLVYDRVFPSRPASDHGRRRPLIQEAAASRRVAIPGDARPGGATPSPPRECAAGRAPSRSSRTTGRSPGWRGKRPGMRACGA